MLNDDQYKFWDMPFVKNAPDKVSLVRSADLTKRLQTYSRLWQSIYQGIRNEKLRSELSRSRLRSTNLFALDGV